MQESLETKAAPPDVDPAAPKHLLSFGTKGNGVGQFKESAQSVAISEDGKILVGCEGKVQIFTSAGTLTAQHQCTSAYGIVIDNGDVFFTDSGMGCIVVCRLDGGFVRKFGGKGNGDGQFSGPCGIAADGRGLLFVADSSNNRVQVVRRNGSFVRKWGTYGRADGEFWSPVGVAFANGQLFVSEFHNYRIQVTNYSILKPSALVSRCLTILASFCANSAASAQGLYTSSILEGSLFILMALWSCATMATTACKY